MNERSANLEWLKLISNTANYLGQWVVLRDGEVLAHAEQLREIKDIPPDALVVKICLDDELEVWFRIGGDYDDQT